MNSPSLITIQTFPSAKQTVILTIRDSELASIVGQVNTVYQTILRQDNLPLMCSIDTI